MEELVKEITDVIDAYFKFQFSRKINIHDLKDGDILVVRTWEPMDPELLQNVKNYLMKQRPDLKTLGIMNVGIEEDIEVMSGLKQTS